MIRTEPTAARLPKGAPVLLAVALLALQSTPALAQDENDIRVRVGLGVQTLPDFVGADDNSLAPLFDLSIKRGTEPFEASAPDKSMGFALISSGGFSLGPAVNFERKRKDSDVGAPLGKVKATIETGGFVQYDVSDSFRLWGELRKGLGGHEGLVGNIAADYIVRDGDRYAITIGPRLLFSDSKYQRAYFGVSPEAALASGLPAYRPDGGLHAIAAASGVHYSIGGAWGLFGYARYEHLIGDAADSPVIRELGSKNQYSGGIGLTYAFVIRR